MLVSSYLSGSTQETQRREIQAGSFKSTAITQVINHLLVQPHTSALLTQKIGVYSASQINRCLRQLKNAGLIGVFKDPKRNAIFYYNIGLDHLTPHVIAKQLQSL